LDCLRDLYLERFLHTVPERTACPKDHAIGARITRCDALREEVASFAKNGQRTSRDPWAPHPGRLLDRNRPWEVIRAQHCGVKASCDQLEQQPRPVRSPAGQAGGPSIIPSALQ
jgi:hypothetical protein